MPQLAPLIYLSLGGQFEADGKGSICPIIPDNIQRNRWIVLQAHCHSVFRRVGRARIWGLLTLTTTTLTSTTSKIPLRIN